MAVTNLELPQESPIFDCSRCSPENPKTFHLNLVGIPPSPNRTITTNIYLCNCDENNEEDKDKWEVDYDR